MEIKNKEELLLKLRMNVIELSNEYPTFEKQVVKKIHSTIIKMIERGERYESIKALINYMIAGGRIKVKGLYCKLKEAMLKLNYSINDKINSFDDFQKILTELEVYFRTEL